MKETPSELDETDLAILRLLSSNARRTLGDIGEQVGLSVPAVKRRIEKLEQLKIILGYTTKIDYVKMGMPIEAFTELRFIGNVRVDTIACIADDIPEVEAVFTMAGDPDALAWIRARDVQHLKTVIDRLRSSGKVGGTKTLIVLGTSTPRKRRDF